jgi:hypothetical protein
VTATAVTAADASVDDLERDGELAQVRHADSAHVKSSHEAVDHQQRCDGEQHDEVTARRQALEDLLLVLSVSVGSARRHRASTSAP